MTMYNSLEEIAIDLKKVNLKRQIAKEQLLFKYNTMGNLIANTFITNTLFKTGKALIIKYITNRIIKK